MKVTDYNTKPLTHFINDLPALEIRYLNVKGSGLAGSWIIEIETSTVVGHIENGDSRVWLGDRTYLQAIRSAVTKYEQASGREIQIIIDAQFRPRPRLRWLSTFEEWMKPKSDGGFMHKKEVNDAT